MLIFELFKRTLLPYSPIKIDYTKLTYRNILHKRFNRLIRSQTELPV